MKLISFVVCCYNSQDYMRDALDSLLKGGEDVEIIVVDDGSKDDTPKIADEYGEKYPSIIKVVHQPNGGHGAGVMAGVREATGQYFKIVDSDDWVDDEGYRKVLDTIKKLNGEDKEVDLIMTDFQYYHGKKPVSENSYETCMPVEKIFGWADMKKMKISQNFLIQSIMFRTQMLKDDGLNLPRKVFYEDTLFNYHNMFYVDKIYYIHQDFYCYNVGRPGQSVEADTSIRRYKDFLKVAELCFACNDPYKYKSDKAKFKILYHIIRISFYMCVCYARMKNTKESKKDLKEMFATCKKTNKKLYRKLRYWSLGWPLAVPGPFGYLAAKISYKAAQRIVKFN